MMADSQERATAARADVQRFDPSLPPAATPARDKLKTVRPANHTVAVVDDEDNIRETLAFALRREGDPPSPFPPRGEGWEPFPPNIPGPPRPPPPFPGMTGPGAPPGTPPPTQ